MNNLKALTAAAACGVLLIGIASAGASTPRRSTSTAAATAANAPIRAAFEYNWFPERDKWGTHFDPTLGKYDSSSPSIFASHVSMAKYAGLDAFISSWWGRGTPTATRLPLELNAARAQGFHIAPYYERASKTTAPTAAQLQSDFNVLYSEAHGDSAWLTVGGKPVLFTNNTRAEATCAAVDRIKSASAGRFYVNMRVFDGYRSCASQPDSWHQYAPTVGYDQQSAFSATVSPGYFKYDEATPRLVRDLSTFKANLARQVASGSQWQLTTTFNEWGDGTSVEPATQWNSTSGNGQYLDAMRAAYGGAEPGPSPTPTAPATTAPVTSAPPTPTPSAPATSATPTPTTTTPAPKTAVTKVLVFVEENHSLSQMQKGMPYLFSQANKYGYGTGYTAATHPSLPNYLAFASGSTFGIADDSSPSSHAIAAPDVFGAAIAAGRKAKSYQESMPSNCATTSKSPYAVKHNPWAYVGSDRTRCLAGDVPSGTSTSGALHADIAAGTLPNVGEVTPNLNNDAHDGTLSTADGWLKSWLTLIYASPDWASGHLAVIITADEDDRHQGNLVLTTVIHPSQHGHVVTTRLTHYSLTTLLTQVGHASCIRSGCTAPSFANAFGLTIG